MIRGSEFAKDAGHCEKGCLTQRRILIKNKAFTLAEVLITLGIIGIVAALTIPNLLYSYKKKTYSARLKQYYSLMSQAVKLAEIDNGPKANWERSPMDNYNDKGQVDFVKAKNHCYNYFIRYLAPYIKYTKENIKDEAAFYMTNGTKVLMWNGSCMDIKADINGDNPPNKNGYDQFHFMICPDSDYTVNAGYDHGSNDREHLLNNCKTEPSYCPALLRYDDWEFKDDYPYKF